MQAGTRPSKQPRGRGDCDTAMAQRFGIVPLDRSSETAGMKQTRVTRGLLMEGTEMKQDDIKGRNNLGRRACYGTASQSGQR